jgi:hypothetical protein
MTNKEAEDRAGKLGLSAWVVQAVVVDLSLTRST